MNPNPPAPPSATDPAPEELRLAALLRQAPVEFARVVYGIHDRAGGKNDSLVALDVERAERHGVAVTRDRAEQRARAYLPVAGHEHCPRCWVFAGTKSPLHLRAGTLERPETCGCKVCGAEYATGAE